VLENRVHSVSCLKFGLDGLIRASYAANKVELMTTSKLNGFRDILTKRCAELEGGNRRRGALAIETSPEELDRIQQAQDRDLAIGAIDRDTKLLREVRSALARIDDDTFGICRDCDEEIGPKRLAAVPWTALCIVCQEATDALAAGQTWSEEEVLQAS
jgi:DnaK suppressor protein